MVEGWRMDGLRAADAWSREAWRVRLLAAELDMVLDDDALIVSDVYDLRALGARLRQLLIAPRRRSLADRALILSGLGRARPNPGVAPHAWTRVDPATPGMVGRYRWTQGYDEGTQEG